MPAYRDKEEEIAKDFSLEGCSGANNTFMKINSCN